MAIASHRVTVDQSGQVLTTTPTDLAQGQSALVRNRSATDSVDLGGASVTSGTGFELGPGESATADIAAGETLKAIAASGKSVRVDVLESGI